MNICSEKINKSFKNGGITKLQVLENIEFNVKAGEFFCIVGPSGCGKTTLLNTLAGFDKPTNGRVLIGNNEMISPKEECLTVFQDHSLFPWRTILENVAFGLEIKGVEKEKRESIAMRYLKLMKLGGFENYFPRELSGGMKQRAQLARALATKPAVLFMDEPFGALDPVIREGLENEIVKIWKKEKITIVLVTHNISSAVFLADRVAIMTKNPGKIKQIISVNVTRPRKRTNPELILLERKILSKMKEGN